MYVHTSRYKYLKGEKCQTERWDMQIDTKNRYACPVLLFGQVFSTLYKETEGRFSSIVCFRTHVDWSGDMPKNQRKRVIYVNVNDQI